MKLLLIFLFYISIFGWTWGDSLASKNKEGNKLYKDGKVDEALFKWRDAQIENPDNNKLHYNIGNGLHEQKKYEDAFNEYEKTLGSKDSELQQKAYYNIGNTHYRMGKLPEAIEDYKKCLAINPDDEDAKYNIEFIKKKLKENEKKENEKKETEKKENGEQKESRQKDAGQQKSQESKDDKENQMKENQAQEDKQQPGQEEKKEENQSKEEKEKSGNEKPEENPEEKSLGEADKEDMSKEDAVRLLDAMKDDEKDIQKELRNQPVEGRYRVDKDW